MLLLLLLKWATYISLTGKNFNFFYCQKHFEFAVPVVVLPRAPEICQLTWQEQVNRDCKDIFDLGPNIVKI